MIKIIPAIYMSSKNELQWVDLPELAGMLGMQPSQIVKRYGALYEHADVCFHYADNSKPNGIAEIDLETLATRIEELCNIDPELFEQGFFVPSSWANSVVDAFCDGYTRVDIQVMKLGNSYKPKENWLSVSSIKGQPDHYAIAIGYKD